MRPRSIARDHARPLRRSAREAASPAQQRYLRPTLQGSIRTDDEGVTAHVILFLAASTVGPAPPLNPTYKEDEFRIDLVRSGFGELTSALVRR
jgi:hypothetical protein